jgi:hypothetical protein
MQDIRRTPQFAALILLAQKLKNSAHVIDAIATDGWNGQYDTEWLISLQAELSDAKTLIHEIETALDTAAEKLDGGVKESLE